MVHEGLKSGWSIAKSREYDSWFKKAKRDDECTFSLIIFPDPDVVESPSNNKLGKDSEILHVID